MSTAARKARKRAGVKFVKAQKVGTPVEERSYVTQPVRRVQGDALPAGAKSLLAPRSTRRIERFIASGGRTRLNVKIADATDESRMGLVRRWINRHRAARAEGGEE